MDAQHKWHEQLEDLHPGDDHRGEGQRNSVLAATAHRRLRDLLILHGVANIRHLGADAGAAVGALGVAVGGLAGAVLGPRALVAPREADLARCATAHHPHQDRQEDAIRGGQDERRHQRKRHRVLRDRVLAVNGHIHLLLHADQRDPRGDGKEQEDEIEVGDRLGQAALRLKDNALVPLAPILASISEEETVDRLHIGGDVPRGELVGVEDERGVEPREDDEADRNQGVDQLILVWPGVGVAADI
mmetsp:Transcript_116952/g.338008  ORF Transcript_116952/g.338008 Transcript_116952/m.338008 type:complete len:245 (-) Transcript_116952:3623-4357(-)